MKRKMKRFDQLWDVIKHYPLYPIRESFPHLVMYPVMHYIAYMSNSPNGCYDKSIYQGYEMVMEGGVPITKSDVDDILKVVEACPRDLVYIPVSFSAVPYGHQLMAVVDKGRKTVELFDPSSGPENYTERLDVQRFKETVVDVLGYEFISPFQLCPVNLQKLPGGHGSLCVLFSLVYAILRIINPDCSSSEVAGRLLHIVTHNESYIRKFGSYVVSLLKRIPDWYLDKMPPPALSEATDNYSDTVGAKRYRDDYGVFVHKSDDFQIEDRYRDPRLRKDVAVRSIITFGEVGTTYRFVVDKEYTLTAPVETPLPAEYEQVLYLDNKGKAYGRRLADGSIDYTVIPVKNSKRLDETWRVFIQNGVSYYCDVHGNPCQTWDPRTWTGWGIMQARRAQKRLARGRSNSGQRVHKRELKMKKQTH